ncbi:hypothetical protein Q1W71_21895 [Flavobacterium pectinovorum]|uniref:hypothetical protein n=1 Tax=Flavobacterium pectinovorum TaxID=29533 RepID=UPI0026604990|nr:hypothetical protein [Flavobacterium pectinovorum]WKL47597.1 hypothetical protein Q1W71_21895 [Flavobacterium pectinovorum]
MRKTIQIIISLSILVFASCQNKNNNVLDGKSFIGFEEDVYYDSPGHTFQTILTFEDDSVIVVKNLISIVDKDTLNFKKKQSSYQYKGFVKKEKNNLEFVAYAYNCKGCEVTLRVDKNGNGKKFLDKKKYKGFVTKNGINLNGINFKPK